MYSALKAEVVATLPRYFFSSLLAHLYCLPRYPILWCKWQAEEFPRSPRSSSSSNDGPLRLCFLDSHPRVRPRLVCKWAFFHPQMGINTYNLLWKYCEYSTYLKIYIFKKKNLCNITRVCVGTFGPWLYPWQHWQM